MGSPSHRQAVRSAVDQLRAELLAARTEDGHWTGQLSASALSTATAISAISVVIRHGIDSPDERVQMQSLVHAGMDYLTEQQNDDGGFGDTDRSHSNIATSYLALAAAELASQAIGRKFSAEATKRLQVYLQTNGEIEGLRRRYGKDKTFVVPILTNLAIAGLVDWSLVPPLPFEAAVFPQSMYRLLRMPVVSYAIPALVAIGQARHILGPRQFLPIRLIRNAAVKRTLAVLRKMQPESGGFLEATPLTSFVLMSLAATGRGNQAVSRECLRFLNCSIGADGSWPIDTNLATWVTSLAITSLARDPDDDGAWCSEALLDWHLDCQHRIRHPFTGAAPGGWGWTDLSGAVPDADDTPGAMLAFAAMRDKVGAERAEEIDRATESGRKWLLDLQNRDGGWPTFCRGWGKLPFDRSSTDLTAHALRAIGPTRLPEKSRIRAERFLTKSAHADGRWLPLWFGNQDQAEEENPFYGTARVLLAGANGHLSDAVVSQGVAFLVEHQNPDGGWGGGPSLKRWMDKQNVTSENVLSSVEETAVAVEALATLFEPGGRFCPADGAATLKAPASVGVGSQQTTAEQAAERFRYLPSESCKEPHFLAGGGNKLVEQAIIRGVDFLLQSILDGRHQVAWPIGFYFAKLWYHEKLYPLVFNLAALSSYLRMTARTSE